MGLRSTSSGGSTAPADTKARILDAAEHLFIESGYEAMSMRQVTSTADVNLAAVNYHFGGKESLIQAVLSRYLDPVNAERLRLLEVIEAEGGDAINCEKVLVAMFLPTLRHTHGGGASGQRFLRFIGRAYTDPSPVVRDFLSSRYAESSGRFFMAFSRSLPHLEREELGFRLNFALSALSGVLAGGNTSRLLNEFTKGRADDELMVLSRLAALIVAALKAPLPDTDQLASYVALLHKAGVDMTPHPTKLSRTDLAANK